MRPATAAELDHWDQLVEANPGGPEILQSRTWAEFKGRHGWKPHFMMIDELKTAAVFLGRRASGFGEVLYCPKGPGVVSGSQMTVVADALRRANPPAFVVKVEPELPLGEEVAGWVKAPFDIHISQATTVLNLEPDESEIMAKLKQKTRYNIHLSQRAGMIVENSEATEQASEDLYRLMMATQSRTGFAARSKDYYFDYWKAQLAVGQGRIFLAKKGDQVLAGAFVQIMGSKAWYKDGGSLREQTELQAPYALQWEIITWLKAHGVLEYDLVGLPRQGDDTSPLSGLVQFKTGFNGEFREFVGTYDLPLNLSKYRLWRRVGERATLRYTQRVKHDLWY